MPRASIEWLKTFEVKNVVDRSYFVNLPVCRHLSEITSAVIHCKSVGLVVVCRSNIRDEVIGGLGKDTESCVGNSLA